MPGRAEVIGALHDHAPLTASQIARRAGAKPAAVHYHLAALTRIGLVRTAGVQATGRRPATLFELSSRQIQLARRPRDPEYQNEKVRAIRLMLTRASREIVAAERTSKEPRPSLVREVVRLTPDQHRELRSRLDQLTAWARAAEAASAGSGAGDLVRIALTIAVAAAA